MVDGWILLIGLIFISYMLLDVGCWVE